MPEWLVDAFYKATNPWYSMDVKTLDEAFGVEWPKRKHFADVKRDYQLRFAVFNRVMDARIYDRKPISDATFAEIAPEFHVSGSVVSRYYYEALERLGIDESPPPGVPLWFKGK